MKKNLHKDITVLKVDGRVDYLVIFNKLGYYWAYEGIANLSEQAIWELQNDFEDYFELLDRVVVRNGNEFLCVMTEQELGIALEMQPCVSDYVSQIDIVVDLFLVKHPSNPQLFYDLPCGIEEARTITPAEIEEIEISLSNRFRYLPMRELIKLGCSPIESFLPESVVLDNYDYVPKIIYDNTIPLLLSKEVFLRAVKLVAVFKYQIDEFYDCGMSALMFRRIRKFSHIVEKYAPGNTESLVRRICGNYFNVKIVGLMLKNCPQSICNSITKQDAELFFNYYISLPNKSKGRVFKEQLMNINKFEISAFMQAFELDMLQK